ncbi:conserved Plasmodium protein, unknown function [Plasmodium berghei]|uniref:Crystalloid-specific PH domain-containing protein, putative n=2 Tax=Plasmodium berghei TaxID=5821 RepID=A0A509AJL0_PLABA|nr:crystalloid-specific PH domain-containing protein, putative [Plasmodium berghei ANKA]CXI23413.1 conserved Plasmodium protein, unknown function [Plasmodium berghei]SCM20197.1 conserved Plasmodium protein, unknown function [Plasmodium berghei]SCN23825.1 conserved Plasmodium protein, unknown function [Plasmodium berghei]SCO59257.1 conserved Plasmodium protein, unknown function [Plasmodium berghei]SCO60215.1 conserved Plasmodium protein, unknown function [Plasmodium berghei]|eukprot:XP_034420795.1 crystalloid-specific PH domain-containing protein, putative [Plasmodium berghei ANKA]
MKIFVSISFVCLISFCKGHKNFSRRNNYLQYLRSQTFMQEKSKLTNFNGNYSEDITEFDIHEDDEYNNFKNDKKKEKDTLNDKDMKENNKLEFKNLEKELNTNDVNNSDSINIMGSGKECSVNEKGELDVSINSQDIFNLIKYMVEITSNSIIIKDIKNSNVVKELPYGNIKLPIETIEETRECWSIKFNKEKIIFCEKNKQNRDKWVKDILKALFCYNTNNLTIENNQNVYKQKSDIPKHSTVNERIQNLKETLTNDKNNFDKQKSTKHNNNIVISNLKSSNPNISLK